MKTLKTESQLIRIMKSSNPMISMEYLKGFKQVAQLVVFTQLSLTSSGIKFSIPIVEAELQHQNRFISCLIKR